MMDKEGWKRLKGLRRLIHEGVGRGADFVEKHHRHAASKPFQVLESITPIAAPTSVVRSIHDGVLSLTYGSIRAINQAAEKTSGWVVDTLAAMDEADERKPPTHP
jgi:hypothetical protein